MSKEQFYGTDQPTTISYLEFGAIDMENSRKEIWDFRLHQKAYDWLMLARYANDMVAYANLSSRLGNEPLNVLADYYEEEMHHAEDASLNLSKLCALASLGKTNPSFFELGQTVFGCIEGMDFIQSLAEKREVSLPKMPLTDVHWYGVDISEYFNDLAKRMHQGYKMVTTVDLDSLPKKLDVFFAKGVTLLYGVHTSDEFLKLLNRCRCAIFDYSFSMNKEQVTTIGTGKTVTYVDINEFEHGCQKLGVSLFVRKETARYSSETDRVFVDCVFGEESVCNEYMQLDRTMRQQFSSWAKEEPGLQRIGNNQFWESNEWLPVTQYLESLRSEGKLPRA